MVLSYVRLMFLVMLLFSCADNTQSYFPAPSNPPRLVNDFAGVFSNAEVATLESKLVQYEKKTTAQIAVVTMLTIGNANIRDYAVGLGDYWGVGTAAADNGVVILLATSQKNVFLATGSGIDTILTDEKAQVIVDNDFVPNFKNGDYYEGIDQGVDSVMEILPKDASAYLTKSFWEKLWETILSWF